MTLTFNYVGLITADMPAALAFYRKLGLDIPAGADSEGHVEVTLPNGLRLAWDSEDEIKKFDTKWQQPSAPGRINFAFECGSPAEVDKAYEEVVAAGHKGHREPWDAFWGQRYASVLDPDGNSIDLYAPLR